MPHPRIVASVPRLLGRLGLAAHQAQVKHDVLQQLLRVGVGAHRVVALHPRIDDEGSIAVAREIDAADGESRAAGGVVGGADVAAENSASGVSLATGLVAGRTAGEAV